MQYMHSSSHADDHNHDGAPCSNTQSTFGPHRYQTCIWKVLLLSYAHVLDACESQGPLRGTATKCNQQYSIKNEDTNDYYPPNWLSSRGNDTVGHGQAEAAFLYHSHQQLEGMSVLGHLGWYSGGGYTGTYIHLGCLLDLLVSPASWFLVRGYTRICSNICVDSVELIVFRETYSIRMHSNVMLRGRIIYHYKE
jgi:hypothetical protein